MGSAYEKTKTEKRNRGKEKEANSPIEWTIILNNSTQKFMILKISNPNILERTAKV